MLPKNLEKETTHRYGPNSFKLHRLPMPRAGQVLGLVGTNGIGKSTALKILSGKLKPNLGKFSAPPDWHEIINYFRGSELQNYLTRVLEDDIKALIKPQYVDHIPKAVKGVVLQTLQDRDERGKIDELIPELDLENVLERDVKALSGGELQRFAIGVIAVQEADVYMFDEPSSYLDVKQRLKASRVIRSPRVSPRETVRATMAMAAATVACRRGSGRWRPTSLAARPHPAVRRAARWPSARALACRGCWR